MSSSGPPVPTPNQFPALGQKMELQCGACGKKGKYDVGRVFVDPTWSQQPEGARPPMDESVGFTGYVHCRRCGAGGPWQLTTNSRFQVMALMLQAIHNPQQARIHLVKLTLFDGTVVRTTMEGEAHLQKLIEANPDDYFLWSRLGNLYETAELPDRAFAAFEKAVALNPRDVESHYSLGCMLQEKGERAQAVGHLHAALRYAHTPQRSHPQLLHDMVRDALERLYELHSRSRTGPSLPLPEGISPESGLTEEALRKAFPAAPADDQGWERLTSFYLTGTLPVSSRPAPPLPLPGRSSGALVGRPAAPVGRNDPCPCGSGRKFKNCCLRS
jgi:hypothetical protein